MTATPTTACERAERVAEYVLRALPPSERSAFETHIEQCPACRQELEALQPVVDAFVDWPIDILRPPTPLWPRLAQRIAADTDGDCDGESSAEPEARRPAAFWTEARWIDEPEWKEVAPGISCKLLATDTVSERVSMLVRLAPGVAYPPHSHAGVEELHLLDGELWIEDRKLYPGDYNLCEPGTADDRVWTETGCTCVLVTSFSDVLR
jgi:quercetin dioxygenase-like cupin family protein